MLLIQYIIISYAFNNFKKASRYRRIAKYRVGKLRKYRVEKLGNTRQENWEIKMSWNYADESAGRQHS
jgi:hypothetical protein